MMKKQEKVASSTSTTSTTSSAPTVTAVAVETNVKKPRNIVAGLKAFAERVNAAGVDGLRATFTKLQQRGPHPPKMSVAVQTRNKAKCRYFDVPCLDETRVILKPWPNAQGDFIHANWVSHEFIDNKFICTQGPLENTIGDFWRMIWQENIDLILMLCRVTEDGKSKCAQYWPNTIGGIKTFYGITIKNETIRNKDPDIWGTDLLVSYGGEQRRITHYQWITWPDKFVPQQLVVPFILLSLARSRKQPTVIHCSAGIGRTGTLVALEVFIRALLQGNDLSISDIIWSIRSQRSRSVQNEEQFLYIHYIIIQRLINKGILSDKIASNFCRNYEHYYFVKTHMVQVPLPIYVRKRSPSQIRNRPIAKVSLTNATDDTTKPLERRAKCLAFNEETLAAIRMSFTRRTQSQFKKSRKLYGESCAEEVENSMLAKTPSMEKSEMKEMSKAAAPDTFEVEKAVKRAIDMVRQFQASKTLPDSIQHQYNQALRALEALQLTTEEVKNGAQIKTPTTLSVSVCASKTAVCPPPFTTPSRASIGHVVNVKGTAETKQQENFGKVCVENGIKESDDDDDFSATYYFMQPEWAGLYPPERKKNSEAVEEHYASEGLEKNMEGSSK
uniref:Tyrosine-protein phosphatase 10D n=1 Tax=Ascaris suum TaxID=6253 RepID=F1L0F8_ASCSU